MEAIETKTIQQDGHTYCIRIFHDEDAENPLTDWCEIGTILSLNRRHVNFDPDGALRAIAYDPDAVTLSYYEHGQCLWAVGGELPAVARCRWDSVEFAGVWLPDAETLMSARNYGGWTRRQFMRKRARQACDAFAQWCNGEIYGYEIERVSRCDACAGELAEFFDACWGFFGLDYCRAEALGVIDAQKTKAA